MDVNAIQTALREHKVDGWLFCDFRNRDFLAYKVLGLNFEKMNTRRWFYFIPARGIPRKIVSAVESHKLDSLPGNGIVYQSWVELHAALKRSLGTKKTIAMQYSPKNNVPYVSLVDGGTIELIKGLGHKVVSSADLVLQFVSVIGEEGYATHKEAGVLVDRICEQAFDKVRMAVRNSVTVTEFDIQQFIMKRFAEHNLITYDPPMVGTNEHPADPHFDLTQEYSRPIVKGDTLLIDLWAKFNKPGAIYYDITWVAFVGHNPPPKYQKIFEVVRDARDAAITYVQERISTNKPCYGWSVDDVCRNVVKKAGFGKYFVHRTGHSITEETHGNGVNIDNLETKDDRRLIPGCCFSIEPGIYLEKEMAVRTEINMFIKHDGTAEVTGNVQREMVLLE